MFTDCPRTRFSVQPTVSLFNVLHLPDFQRDWLERGWVELGEFHLNPLLDPTYYRVQILPRSLKDAAAVKITAHIDGFLRPLGRAAEKSIQEFTSVLRLMEANDRSSELETFRAITARLDALRKENFAEVFPELASLARA